MAHKAAIGVFFVILMVSSLALGCFSAAQAEVSNAKPSVPEYNVQFVDTSYDVPSTSTTTTDPYTGANTVVVHEGYHIQNASFVVAIKNQLFTGYEVNGNYTALYYGIEVKGHFTPDWGSVTFYYTQPYIQSSGEEYTTLAFGLTGNNDTTAGGDGQSGFVGAALLNGAYGGQLDFRVMSLVGYYVTVQDPVNAFNVRHPYHEEFVPLQTSGWSSTQSVDVPAVSQSSPAPTSPASTAYPTTTSNTPEAPESEVTWLLVGAVAGLGIVIALLVVVVAFMSRKIGVLEHKLST
jgi:hypothetical protein